MNSETLPQRFSNRPAQIGSLAFGLFLSLLGALQFTADGAPAVGLVTVLIGSLFAMRGWRSSEVVLHEDEVETRSMLLTRRVRISDLDSVEVVVGRTGAGSGKRECLEFRLVGGSTRRFFELNAPPPSAGLSSPVRLAAEAIQCRIRMRQ